MSRGCSKNCLPGAPTAAAAAAATIPATTSIVRRWLRCRRFGVNVLSWHTKTKTQNDSNNIGGGSTSGMGVMGGTGGVEAERARERPEATQHQHEAQKDTSAGFSSCCSGSFCIAGGRCFHSQIARRWQRLCRARKAREKPSKKLIQLDQAKEIESRVNSNKCSIANDIAYFCWCQ